MDEPINDPKAKKVLDKVIKAQKQSKIPYECRVQTITREVIRHDGSKVVRISTKVLDTPTPKYLKDGMVNVDIGRTYQSNTFIQQGMEGVSNRENPRITNNKPKFKRINGRRFQVRSIPFKVLNDKAMILIKEGMGKELIGHNKKVKKEYLKTMLRTKQRADSSGFNKQYNRFKNLLPISRYYGKLSKLTPHKELA